LSSRGVGAQTRGQKNLQLIIIAEEHKRHDAVKASAVKNIVGGRVGISMPSIPRNNFIVEATLQVSIADDGAVRRISGACCSSPRWSGGKRRVGHDGILHVQGVKAIRGLSERLHGGLV
jgi:hypothetical protein